MLAAGSLIRASDMMTAVRVQEAANSAAITTVNTGVATLTFNAVSGGMYELRFNLKLVQTVGTDTFLFTVYENSVGGTTIDQWGITLQAASVGMMRVHQIDWTASATGSKTIVGALVRASGTGNIVRSALSNYQVRRFA